MKSLFAGMLAASFAAATMANAALDPDVVLYYDFETMGSDPNKVANIANPGTMDLSGGGNWAGASYPVEATPAATLRQALLADTSEVSAKALRTTWSSGDSYAYRYFLPTENWFSTTNFTVEFFYKMDGTILAYTPLFRRTGANNVQVNIGVGGTANKLRATVMTGEDAGSFATVSIDDDAATGDGKWHHAALVVSQTGETKTMRFYRDYKSKGSKTLAANVTAANTEGRLVTLSGRGDGNCFNGWMDSVRVTLRALEPQEFLTVRPYASGSTITHISFDDETPNASADYGTLREGKYQGSIVPTYSDDVPGTHIRDGADGELLTKHNAKSISFPDTTDHSWVSYGSLNSNPLDVYHFHSLTGGQYRTSGTIEFWMKSSQTDADYDTVLWGGYASRTDNVGNVTSYQPSLIRFNSNHRLEFGFNASGTWRAVTAASVDVLDGKWHHVAFTFKPAPANAAQMVATCFIDYAQAASLTCDGQLRLENNGYFDLRFAGQHGNGSNNVTGEPFSHKNYGGLIDELRISDVALAPSQFLRAEKDGGTVICFR